MLVLKNDRILVGIIRFLIIYFKIFFGFANFSLYLSVSFNIAGQCLKNLLCDIIKMREIRGEEGKETPKKEMDNPLFL